MNALLRLVSRWREEADLLRSCGATEAAATTEKHAMEVVTAVERAEDEELSLTKSASVSGYSKRRLSELLADGTIPNAGRKGAPRIRRGDLPKRVGSRSADSFDALTEAKLILGGTGGPT